jgi:4-amino-4-deoxy-L-arabinose transferase-like glycosyltransferase
MPDLLIDSTSCPSRLQRGTKALWHGAALLVSLGISAWLLYRLAHMPPQGSYERLPIVWLSAACLYFVALIPRNLAGEAKGLGGWISTHRWHCLAVAGLTLAALLLRVWKLGSIPFTLEQDEALIALQGQQSMGPQIPNLFITGFLSQPTMYYYLEGLLQRVLGTTIAGIRLPWAVLGAATIPLVFLLVRRLAGWRMAYLTASLVAFYHFHIHYSRLNLNNIADPFFMTLALLALECAIHKRRPIDWALCGAMCGASLYFYTGGRLTLIVIGLTLVYEIAFRLRSFIAHQRLAPIVALGAFFIVGGPMTQHAIRSPDEFNGRVKSVGFIQCGYMKIAMERDHTTAVGAMWEQVRRSALAFNYYSDKSMHYHLPYPLLDPVFGGFFLLGLGYGTLCIFRPSRGKGIFPMVAWWWSGMFIGGALTVDPPTSQRLVTLTVPTCYFVALGMERVFRLAANAFKGFPVRAALTVGAIGFSVLSLRTYFVEAVEERYYAGPHSELSTMIAPDLNRVKTHSRIFMHGWPAMNWGLLTLPFLVPSADVDNVDVPITGPPSANIVTAKRGAMFVFLPDRIRELELVRKTFPAGKTLEFRSPVDNRVFVTLYEVPPLYDQR